MRSAKLIVAVLAAMLGVAPRANAHAFLDHAAPAVGSSVHGSPLEVKLWFTQALEAAFSTVRVLDGDGKAVDTGDRRVDSEDRTLLRVSLPRLPPGTYRVKWRVLSADTHVTEGDYTFDIVP